MKNSKPFLIGDVLSGSEAAFLRVLAAAFPAPETLFLANFHVGAQQIDFLVVTPTHVGMIELKQFAGPVFGEMNGGWELIDVAGNRVPHSSSSNPYNQALKQTYALSDAMHAYRKHASVPNPERGQYFRNFKTYVAIAPAIHPASRVTSGDYKARILSADAVVEQIRTQGHASTWSPADWRAFAVEHLHLRPATLNEAIDPQTLEAANTLERFRERSRALIGTNLPPLLAVDESEVSYGRPLVVRLAAPDNVLLIGPGGSAKTFHLHHAAIAMLEGDDELPILVEAKRYRGGDFWPFLRTCLAPLFPGDPRHLLEAITSVGMRPALLIDALNECAPAVHADLLKSAVAFALQYNARTIITMQESVTIAGLTASQVEIALPDAEQRRQIFAFHANVHPAPELDDLCRGFLNAYDLTIAGRCHGVGQPPIGPLELYDRYVSECLPRQHRTVAGALARHLAAEMGERGSLHLTRNDCEASASHFLARHDAPLTILDDLMHSRLLDTTDDIVTFEHELLFKYLRSSALERHASSIGDLCEAVRLPRNRELIEFIIPRRSSRAEVEAILRVCDDLSVFSKCYDGSLGHHARGIVTDDCDAFTTAAIDELEEINCTLELQSADLPRRMFGGIRLSGFSEPSRRDKVIAELIATKDHDPAGRRRLLSLIDAAQSRLGDLVARRAEEDGISPRLSFSELLRLYVASASSAPQPRSTLVLCALRHRVISWRQEPLDPELHSALRSRALQEAVGTFALYLLLEMNATRSSSNADLLVTYVEFAWASGVHYLRMSALFALTGACRLIDDATPAVQQRVTDFLNRIESKDWILSSMIVEAQERFETIEPLVRVDSALSELRTIIAENIPDELKQQFGENGLNEAAYHLLSRIFEDVFQGAYYDAYGQLTESERLQILSLAVGAPRLGFSGSWILQELLKLDRVETLPAFRTAASSIDLHSSVFQDDVAVFVNAIYGFSKFAEAPPIRAAPETPLERAWFVIADALFWAFYDGGQHAATRGEPILAHLRGDDLLAASVVLDDLRHTQWQIEMDNKSMPTFESAYPRQASRIASSAIERREDVRRLFSRFGRDSVVSNAIRILGEIGTPTVTPILREVMNDESIGMPAIKAIHDIEDRAVGARTTAG